MCVDSELSVIKYKPVTLAVFLPVSLPVPVPISLLLPSSVAFALLCLQLPKQKEGMYGLLVG